MLGNLVQFGDWVAGSDGFFMPFFLALVLLATVNVVKCLSKITSGSCQIQLQKMGLESLIECYALGKIDREEFEQRRRNLNS